MEYLTGQAEREAIKWMQEAAGVAKRALCLKAKCGVVIVKDGKIIGQGYNAPPLDKEENRMCDKVTGSGKPRYDLTCCIHAEWRAIMDGLRRHPEEMIGAKLYFCRVDDEGQVKYSGQPYCTGCSRMALDAGLSKFLLWHEPGIIEYPTHDYDQLSYHYSHE